MARIQNSLPPIPIKTPVLDQGGMVSPQWLAFFREIYARIGGSVATSNVTLASQSTSLSAQVAALQSQVDLGVGRQL